MWWLLGMIFCGLLLWFLWTGQTHRIGVFTLPGAPVHIYLDLKTYNFEYRRAWKNDEDFRDNIFEVSVLSVVFIIMVLCSWNFFVGGVTLFWKIVGAYYLCLVLAYTLFLDLMQNNR